jgi:hypothetical protein
MAREAKQSIFSTTTALNTTHEKSAIEVSRYFF